MKLSILIPARNEKYLQKTIDDIFEHAETDVEVVVGLDGWRTNINNHRPIKLFHQQKSIGHRAMTNKLAELAKGKYLMRTDAHCSFSQGFDKEMLDLMEEDITMAPIMCNLNVKEWEVIPLPRCVCYCFNQDLIFDYWEEYEKRDDNTLTETLALQGSCFMVSKKKFFELNLCGEDFGKWGQQGVEVALKTWLSGGRVVTNRNAYYGHLFRAEDEFPYKRNMKEVEKTKDYCKEYFTKHPGFPALIEKFKPIRHWHYAPQR